MTMQVVPTDEVLGHFARQEHDWFERVRKGSLDAEKVVRAVHAIIDAQYPADGVEFELTLDFGAPQNQPLEMVRADGYSEPEKWKFTGQKLSGVQTRRFKLERVGHCRDLDEVRQKLEAHGEIPAGQWRQAFKAAYPNSDGNGPVGSADPSWVDPRGFAHFPYVNSGGGSGLHWANCRRPCVRRWLVPASK